MNAKTEDVRVNDRSGRPIDAFDRKILGALETDARLTYAEIGAVAGLSAPALHERVKRLRNTGVLSEQQPRSTGRL